MLNITYLSFWVSNLTLALTFALKMVLSCPLLRTTILEKKGITRHYIHFFYNKFCHQQGRTNNVAAKCLHSKSTDKYIYFV